MKQQSLIFITIIFCVASLLQLTGALQPVASAVNTDNFNPGLIITDNIFTQKNSMSASQIQDFLIAKNSACLKDFKTLGLYDSNDDGLGDEPYGKGIGRKVKASTLIWQAAQIYDINPRVILATLQKEQGLITRQDCPSWRYNTALGYGCPDTAPCDSSSYGFTRQIDYGTWHFRGFFEDSYPIPPTVPGTKIIPYNPISKCGGKSITISTRATAALYSYTPYQPNRYTLNGGTDDSYPNCGAFGNLNFWRYFNDWFGSSVRLTYESLAVPRWMETSQSLYKVNLFTGKSAQSKISSGLDIRFTSKIYLNGQWYLRTATDTQAGRSLGIPISKLQEINYQSFVAPRYLVATSNVAKINPRTQKATSEIVAKDSYLHYDNLIRVNGSAYYRTSQDSDANLDVVVPASAVSEIPYEPLSLSRWLVVGTDVKRQTIPNLSDNGSSLPAGSHVFFTTKLTYNGKLYLRTKDDTRYGRNLVIPMSALDEIKFAPNTEIEKGWKTTTVNTYKYDPRNGERVGLLVRKGTSFYTLDQITVNGQKYYRTQADTHYGRSKGILAYAVSTPEFVSFSKPREMKVLHSKTPLYDMVSPTLSTISTKPSGRTYFFDSKILIDGIWYYRSSTHTELGLPYAFSSHDIGNP
jgi:hypothetical protein